MVVVIGVRLAKAFPDVGLIDEVQIHMVPMMLGDGIPLWRGAA